MSEMSFEREYLNQRVRPRPLFDLAILLASFYEDATELHDKRVCSGRSPHGTAVPITPDERWLSNEYAKRLRVQLMLLREMAEIPESSWLEAEKFVRERRP